LLALTFYIARRLARVDNNPRLVAILMGGVCLKLIGSAVRYWVAATIYGTGDFYDYDKWGQRISASIRHGHLLHLPGRLAGTDFMRYLTGFIYVVTPARMMSGFLVYGWLSFIGLLFFWRAYRIAISPKRDTIYLLWILLMPSLLYWPSAIGKDAFILLAAGICAYGTACLLTQRLTTGLVALALGLLGMIMVRPHFALAIVGGLALATVFRRNDGGVFRTLVILAFVLGVGFVALQSAKSFFGISAFNQSAIVKTLSEASSQTSGGGSAFTPVVVNSPLKLPLAAATVFYRPFPFEAHSAQEMLTAIEGTVLFILSIRALPATIRALRSGRTYPYFLYCAGALLVFVVAFSGFSNFGILARERSVIQPLFLVFLSLPRRRKQDADNFRAPAPRADPATRSAPAP